MEFMTARLSGVVDEYLLQFRSSLDRDEAEQEAGRAIRDWVSYRFGEPDEDDLEDEGDDDLDDDWLDDEDE